jgi:hypothetical protein
MFMTNWLNLVWRWIVIGMFWCVKPQIIGTQQDANKTLKVRMRKKRSTGTYAAFFMVFLGAIASSVVLGLSVWFQLTIRFPMLIGTSLEYQITQYLLMDALTLLGAILLYFSSALIYQQSSWPINAIIALIGAFITVAIISVVLGVVGGIIALFNRPR